MNHKVLREPSEISRGRSHCISDKARRKNHSVNCVQHLMLAQTRVDGASPNVPSSHAPMFEDPSPLTVMVQLLVVFSNKPCEVRKPSRPDHRLEQWRFRSSLASSLSLTRRGVPRYKRRHPSPGFQLGSRTCQSRCNSHRTSKQTPTRISSTSCQAHS